MANGFFLARNAVFLPIGGHFEGQGLQNLVVNTKVTFGLPQRRLLIWLKIPIQ